MLGSGGAGGAGVDAGVDASDGGSATGWGSCVTQQDVDNQSSLPFEIGFCVGNPFACAFTCPDDCVMQGDTCCSPNCTCSPLPPICGTVDAGSDAPDDAPDDGATDAPPPDAPDDSPSDGPVPADAAPE